MTQKVGPRIMPFLGAIGIYVVMQGGVFLLP